MKFLLVFSLFSITSKAFSYAACKETFNPYCNQQAVESAVENIQENLKDNSDIIFMELVRQKVLSGYDLYEKNMETILKCWDLDPIPEKCLPLLNHYIGSTFEQNIDMRAMLALWNPPGKPHEYNDRNEDKYRRKIKHLGFVDGVKLEPLNDQEEEIAKEWFDIRKESFFENEKIKEEPESFVDVLKYSDGIKDLKMINMDWGKENYLTAIIKNPALKYISKAQPSEEEIIDAFRKYRDELREKRAEVEKLSYKDLKDFLYFDDLVNNVLTENPFFCPNAIRKKEDIDFSRKAKEWLFSLGGLVLCPFTSGYTCAAGLFAGSAVNAIDRISELNTTMKYSITPGTATAENVMERSSNAGLSIVMMGLSLPLGGIAKVGVETLGAKGLRESIGSYAKSVKLNGIKRVFVTKASEKPIMKYGFRLEPERLGLFQHSMVQFYTVGVSKLLTKKVYTFRPTEFVISKAEKLLLKEGREFALPRTLAKTTDTVLERSPYIFGPGIYLNMKYEEINEKLFELERQEFLDYEIDSRFDRLRQLEEQCRKSPSCSKTTEDLISQKKEVIIWAKVKLGMALSEKDPENPEKNKIDNIEDLLDSEYMQNYGQALFYNFYEFFPEGRIYKYGEDGKPLPIEPQLKLTQERILTFELVRNRIAEGISQGEIDRFKMGKPVSDDFQMFLKYTNAEDIIKSDKSNREIYSLVGETLNGWVRASQQAIFDKYKEEN